jgi:nicotinamidase-related amidase
MGMKTALIVIDVQKGFINEQTREMPRKIAEHISAGQYDLVVFTKFVNKPGSNFERILRWKKVYNSPDTDLAEELKGLEGKVIEKPTYSAFKSPSLIKLLSKGDFDKLYLCGLDTDACVLGSAFDAFDLGYNFEVITELTDNMKEDKFHIAGLNIINKNLSKPDR